MSGSFESPGCRTTAARLERAAAAFGSGRERLPVKRPAFSSRNGLTTCRPIQTLSSVVDAWLYRISAL
jgi:hypothetical protein